MNNGNNLPKYPQSQPLEDGKQERSPAQRQHASEEWAAVICLAAMWIFLIGGLLLAFIMMAFGPPPPSCTDNSVMKDAEQKLTSLNEKIENADVEAARQLPSALARPFSDTHSGDEALSRARDTAQKVRDEIDEARLYRCRPDQKMDRFDAQFEELPSVANNAMNDLADAITEYARIEGARVEAIEGTS